MILLDVNILLYAVDAGSVHHAVLKPWLTQLLNQQWRIFSGLLKQTNAKGNLVSDAHLAALALDHNIVLASCDTDFSKFPGLRWINPLTQL